MPDMAFPHHHLHVSCWLILLTSLLMLFNGFSTTILASPSTMNTAPRTTKPGCRGRCGNLTVPYPFGIGSGCALSKWYEIYCNTSFSPPKGFLLGRINEPSLVSGPPRISPSPSMLLGSNIELLDISEEYVRIINSVATSSYKNNLRENAFRSIVSTQFGSQGPYSFSADLNMFWVIGCDYFGFIIDMTAANPLFPNICRSMCSNSSQVMKNSCSTGTGCCQNTVPKGLKSVIIELFSPANRSSTANRSSITTFNSSGYAFLGETDKFTFLGTADLFDPEFEKRIHREVPVVIDWDVGNGTKCAEAELNKSTYACQGNTTYCIDSESNIASGGYRCSCLPGYHGNPYLPPTGCTDIDECQSSTHNCSHYCSNVIGSYKCSCPKRHYGDGFTNGTGCVPQKSQFPMIAGLGTSIGLLFIFICISIIYFITQSQKEIKLREKFFQQNGGYLLRQQLALTQGGLESSTIFTINELKLATDNFNEDRIIGQGGHGTVYKGILQNSLTVAIKKIPSF